MRRCSPGMRTRRDPGRRAHGCPMAHRWLCCQPCAASTPCYSPPRTEPRRSLAPTGRAPADPRSARTTWPVCAPARSPNLCSRPRATKSTGMPPAGLAGGVLQSDDVRRRRAACWRSPRSSISDTSGSPVPAGGRRAPAAHRRPRAQPAVRGRRRSGSRRAAGSRRTPRSARALLPCWADLASRCSTGRCRPDEQVSRLLVGERPWTAAGRVRRAGSRPGERAESQLAAGGSAGPAAGRLLVRGCVARRAEHGQPSGGHAAAARRTRRCSRSMARATPPAGEVARVGSPRGRFRTRPCS